MPYQTKGYEGTSNISNSYQQWNSLEKETEGRGSTHMCKGEPGFQCNLFSHSGNLLPDKIPQEQVEKKNLITR